MICDHVSHQHGACGGLNGIKKNILGGDISVVPHCQLVQFWFFVKRGALDFLLFPENVLKLLPELFRCEAASDL